MTDQKYMNPDATLELLIGIAKIAYPEMRTEDGSRIPPYFKVYGSHDTSVSMDGKRAHRFTIEVRADYD